MVTYNNLAERLITYNSPTNLGNFEAHLLKMGEKILTEEWAHVRWVFAPLWYELWFIRETRTFE